MNIFELALNPAKDYRPVPFWSWNDKLEMDELSRQIHLMREAGHGGFFMHARGGLLTEYIGKEWFDLTKGCIEDAKREDMNAWAYDESGWPSGFGNGIVNGLGLKYQQKYLRCKEISGKDVADIANFIAVYTQDGKRIDKDTASAIDTVLVCYFDVNPYYVDTLDREVTLKFIEAIYQKYYDSLSENERKGMKGFFTDEPQISRNGIPWSFIYEREYSAEFGSSLIDLLPELFLETGCYRKTRYRFWRLTTRLFMNNFLKTIYDWCNERGWDLTGHMVLEDNYFWQITSNGSVMPHYQYYTIPGMDALGRHFTSLVTPKQLESVAAQTGKKQVLSETFALCGWAVTFADLKWLYQWQLVHGINLLCQHLEGYSLRGIRKRDYPASLFIHQPWWPEYHRFNDYVSRLGVLLAESAPCVDTLIIHGVTTAHLLFNRDHAASRQPMDDIIDMYSKAFEGLSQKLVDAHIGHHYGDETLMEQHGCVEGAKLRIGRHSYSVVVLPKLMNLSSRQVTMLEEFANNGGVILGERNDFHSEFYVDGELARNLPLLKQVKFLDSAAEVAAELANYCEAVSITEPGTSKQVAAINAAHRSLANFDGKPAELYYLVNTDRFKGFDTEIVIEAAGVECYNPATGAVEPVFYDKANGKCRIPFRFAPVGDLVLLARNHEVASAAAPAPAGKAIQLKPDFAVKDCSENILTLDMCSCVADGKKMFDREYILTIQNALLKLEREADVELGFEFEVDSAYALGQPLELLIEHPEYYEISLNGKAISNKSSGFFADKAFERIDIGGAVAAGRNSLVLKTHFYQKPETYQSIRAARHFEGERNKLSFHSEVEAVYLCGKFGVKTPGKFTDLERNGVRYCGAFVLTALPSQVNGGNIEQSGFPFFAGKITLEQDFEVANPAGNEISFANLYANVADVKVNGKPLAAIIYPDYKAAIPADLLKPGVNKLEVTLTNSLRNMLGPFHLEDGESFAVGPASFYKDADGVYPPWHKQVWNTDYCFLRFGLN